MAGLIGGLGSAALTVRAAYRLGSPLLVTLLITGWVIGPFVLFVIVDRASKHWATLTRSTLYASMLLVALGSLAIYVRFVYGPTRAKPAFAFVAVPPASVIFAGLAIIVAALLSRGISRES